MKLLLFITLVSAAWLEVSAAAELPRLIPAFQSPLSIIPSLTLATITSCEKSSEAEEASARDHIAEMARLSGTSFETSFEDSQVSFFDYVIVPICIIFALIIILRQTLFI